MPNRYPAPCYRCGEIVPPGDGVFERVSRVQRKKWPDLPRSARWQVQHHECAKQWSNTTRHYIYDPNDSPEREPQK